MLVIDSETSEFSYSINAGRFSRNQAISLPGRSCFELVRPMKQQIKLKWLISKDCVTEMTLSHMQLTLFVCAAAFLVSLPLVEQVNELREDAAELANNIENRTQRLEDLLNVELDNNTGDIVRTVYSILQDGAYGIAGQWATSTVACSELLSFVGYRNEQEWMGQ